MSYIDAIAAGFNALNNYTQEGGTCNDVTDVDADTYAWNL